MNSISKTFNNFVEQSSQNSSVYNGIQGNELNRQLPPLPKKNPDLSVSPTSNYLPIGIGQYSNQSSLGYHKMLQLIQQSEHERNYRLNSMFLNQSENKSCVSKDSGSIPTFTFQNDEHSIKSGSLSKPLLIEPKFPASSISPLQKVNNDMMYVP